MTASGEVPAKEGATVHVREIGCIRDVDAS